jgi:hypothetical protein
MTVKKVCRQQAELIQNHKNTKFSQHRTRRNYVQKAKMLKPDGGQAYDRSSV